MIISRHNSRKMSETFADFHGNFLNWKEFVTILKMPRRTGANVIKFLGHYQKRLTLICKLFFQPLPVGIYGLMAIATLAIGIVCSHTLPSPVSTVLNNPSPPSSIFFMPGHKDKLMNIITDKTVCMTDTIR